MSRHIDLGVRSVDVGLYTVSWRLQTYTDKQYGLWNDRGFLEEQRDGGGFYLGCNRDWFLNIEWSDGYSTSTSNDSKEVYTVLS